MRGIDRDPTPGRREVARDVEVGDEDRRMRGVGEQPTVDVARRMVAGHHSSTFHRFFRASP